MSDLTGPDNPAHPDHVAHITNWTRAAAASEVIVDPKNPNPLTPEQRMHQPSTAHAPLVLKGKNHLHG